jgi:riboflavin kinase/FMN adenylyltransferase
MRILASSRNLLEPAGPFAIGIGIFDGVHLGHRKLLGLVRELADRDGVPSLAFTFDPHPCAVIKPEQAPCLLEPIEQRLEHFAELGIHTVLVEHFDTEFAAIEAARFIDEILVGKLRALHVVVGAGFNFGARGQGTTELLAAAGPQHGYTAHIVDPVEVDGAVVSSTRIRGAVREGRVAEASRLLGRQYALSGIAVRGSMRGRALGFATANLEPGNEVMPACGVYAARASGPFGAKDAVVNIGFAPTFERATLRVEAHLLDYEGQDLYGQPLVLQLLAVLRSEQRFDGIEALKAQIRRDIDAARRVLRDA